MPRLRGLSGAEIVSVLERFGFVVVSQRGSHAKLRRALPDGRRQSLHVPPYRELDTGTRRAIFRQASEFVLESELRPHFFVD